MNEVMRLKWMEYSNDSQTTPLYFELLKFLDMQDRHFESVTSERKLQMTMQGPMRRQLRKSVWIVEEEESIH